MSFVDRLVGAVRFPGIAWSFSRAGFRSRRKKFTEDGASLAGRTLAVTGANGGIGFAIAKQWAERGADVWMLCRNRERGEAAIEKLAGVSGAVHLALVDMADADSIDRVADELMSSLGQLDAIVHNAGALVHDYREVAPGVELTFACHVLGPHRLTRALLPLLTAAPDPRVVFVSSGGMYSEPLRVDKLVEPPRPFDGVKAYARAKRAQVVLTERWAEREPRVRFFAMHPGWVDTPGVETSLPTFYRATKRWLRTPAEGADTAVWLAAADSVSIDSGAFVFDRAEADRYMLPGTRTREGESDALWRAAEQFAGEHADAVAATIDG